MSTLNLESLPAEKSRELLLKLAPRLGTDAEAAAELCGHLPLALEVFAGTVLDKRLYPVTELLERLRSRRDKLVPVEAAFEVSYELLSEDLRLRWAQLAVFPASFDLRAASAVWMDGADAARENMQALVNGSVVDWNESHGRFRLHDLVRQFCEGRLGESERDAARFRHARHYSEVGGEADALYVTGGAGVLHGLELFDRERVHIEAAFDWLSTRLDPKSATTLIGLVNAVVYTGQGLRFHPSQNIRWLEAQRDSARLIQNREAEATAVGNLGIAQFHLGETNKAIKSYEQQFAISRERGDLRSAGSALGNLGNAYLELGDAPKAVEFLRQRLSLAREIGDHRVVKLLLWVIWQMHTRPWETLATPSNYTRNS